MSESSQCMMEIHKQALDLPADVGRKLSSTSLQNPTWHTDVDNSTQLQYHGTYLKLNTYMKNYSYNILAYINIYEYMS